MVTLRPYQEEAKTAILNEWQSEGHPKTLLVLPTGTGKTVVFDSIAADLAAENKRTLILAHRDELLKQAGDKLLAAFNLPAALEKADSHAYNRDELITIGSMQTLCRRNRLEEYPQDYFDAVIVDEAHHSLSDSYKRILDYFKNANVLGVTATPDRGDKKSLSEIFDSIAYEYSMRQAILDGYLCRISAQMIPLKINLKGIHTRAGDYSVDELAERIEPYLEAIADEMESACADRKTVVFLPLIKISQLFRDVLNQHGFRAAEVNGQSPDREEILEDFESGKYNALCNSMLLTEGWDCPSVDCIVVLRPTKVRGLYQQMIGRGTRPHPGKKNLLILDFLWMTQKHDLRRPASLISETAAAAAKIEDIINKDKGEVDLLDAEEIVKKDTLAEREKALTRELRMHQGKQKKTIDPIDYALSLDALNLADYEPTFMWEKQPPTEKQLKALANFKIDTSRIPNKGYASLLLDTLIKRSKQHLATPKQVRQLKNAGFYKPYLYDFQDASKLIDILAQRGWSLPYAYVQQMNIKIKEKYDPGNER